MQSENLIHMAESCSDVRRAIGRMLLAPEGSDERAAAEEHYHDALRGLLRRVREEECGILLEAAGELA
ncbi:MAG: hypothetical protein HMLKMBBP_01607 [Planctomycetes bacterium]|nr:hypothetical protein [Planctomycetota bacterium]